MNLRNYTSTVPVDRSVNEIERLLVRAGATHIGKAYEGEGKSLSGITFQIVVNGIPLTFRLPAKVQAVREALREGYRKLTPSVEQGIWEQAQRTAWKLLYEWVSIQVSMMKLSQVEAVEVFLPYVLDISGEQTLFEKLKQGGFKQLSAGHPKPREADC
jgi:hypothetical protein